MNRQHAGFTLIEISIVLVIIGLLLGGVLKGQELIENAKLKRMNNDFSGIATGAYSYLDRYAAIPGDDSDAKTRWTIDSNPTSPDGALGDGVLDGAWNVATTETGYFWDHLRRSNLITGGQGTKMPVHAFAGKIGVADGYLALTGPVICMDNINGKRAEIIDKQLDDGQPGTGVLRAEAANNPAGTVVVTGTSYDLAETYALCKQM
ncbi:prepilin-type N-terminal cleavage/methylation domain-containing protein [Candidatus Venteria ishoeyi]|uniref:Type II secretion system protein G n=1 Tax=Candidatus Venteria ishoeyi TaxID=1899563 RepID=A0A1H6FDK7_9GAMM|nr:prepilin-type N-terminal cleavage/methylation domain-containing protein [Candidatus Venteria ishoeyi]MDM8546932.1 prepilin-type N-terminal cleavage/methylation domain-containing protein [Candidatus Venteria ishoeyi]SEH07481.1 Uncharacterised protein [Candidatus Venteria ishoeyi]